MFIMSYEVNVFFSDSFYNCRYSTELSAQHMSHISISLFSILQKHDSIKVNF